MVIDLDLLRGLSTVFAMAAFLGVCWWAYRGDKKADFDQAANLPFADESTPQSSPSAKEAQ